MIDNGNNLLKEIIKDNYLKILLTKNDEFIQIHSKERYSHLSILILKTKNYPILNQYIDGFLKSNPDIINMKVFGEDPLLVKASSISKDYSSNETVKILLKNGADINIQNGKGRTALINSVYNPSGLSEIETIKLLIENKANIDIRDNIGYDVTIYACMRQNKDNSILNIVLPNRKIFIDKVFLNRNKILCQCKVNKILTFGLFDYKFIYKKMETFKCILLFL